MILFLDFLKLFVVCNSNILSQIWILSFKLCFYFCNLRFWQFDLWLLSQFFLRFWPFSLFCDLRSYMFFVFGSSICGYYHSFFCIFGRSICFAICVPTCFFLDLYSYWLVGETRIGFFFFPTAFLSISSMFFGNLHSYWLAINLTLLHATHAHFLVHTYNHTM